MKVVIAALILISIFHFTTVEKQYVKQVNDDGTIISEGWMRGDLKDGYWKFYDDQQRLVQSGHYVNGNKSDYWHEYEAGKLIAEGYYNKDLRTNWWSFYNIKGYRIIKKQFENGVLNGYVLYYKKSSLSMVEEYVNAKKIGAWTSYFKFKRDHPDFSLSDLR